MELKELFILDKTLSSYDLPLKRPTFDIRELLFSRLDPDLSALYAKYTSKNTPRIQAPPLPIQQENTSHNYISRQVDESGEEKEEGQITDDDLEEEIQQPTQIVNKEELPSIKAKRNYDFNTPKRVQRRYNSISDDDHEANEETFEEVKHVKKRRLVFTNKRKIPYETTKLGRPQMEFEIKKEQRLQAKQLLGEKFRQKLGTSHQKHAYNIKNTVDLYEKAIFEHNKQSYAKYKGKIVAICQNIIAADNNTFYRKLLEKRIAPEDLVHMKSQEMASDKKIREREFRERQEARKCEELAEEQQRTPVKIIKKNHKGEFEVDVNNRELNDHLNQTTTSSSSIFTEWEGELRVDQTLVMKIY